MVDWKDNKGLGPWDFIEQSNKWGYLNNPLWSNRQDSVDFCEGLGLETDLSGEHAPCGHWHKAKTFPLTAGKWVAAMQQPGTPYIYLYDIEARAVIRVNTAFVPPIVDGVLRLNSAYALDYDMGYGNPGAQCGAYCMNKDGTRIWYLFCDQGLHPVTRDHPDAELVEVDISSYYMRVTRRTTFFGLLTAEAFPGPNAGRVNDGCSDDVHTYWCTDLIAGRIIKIQNSDHSIIDDHTFNYAIEGCGAGFLDEAISTIEADKSNGKLYWIYVRDHTFCVPPYNACRHLIRADIDLIADIDSIACVSGVFTPAWQNMVRIYSNYIFQHRAYHPSTAGYLMKKNLDWVPVGDQVIGTDGLIYSCILDHISNAGNKPTTGGGWSTYWILDGASGETWIVGEDYTSGHFLQEYLQNILGVKDNKLFTLMCVNSANHPAFLYCLDFNGMNEISRLDVSYYAGQSYLPTYDWDWTSVSAMNYQTGMIVIFRYHNEEERNYAGCFSASPSFEFLCDARFEQIYDDPTLGPFGEPQSWPFEGFTPPEIPEEDPPIEVISDPGPGEIIYVPPPTPPDDVPDDGVTLVQSGFADYNIYVGPDQTRYFKFVAAIPEPQKGFQVGNTPDSPYSVHLLIKRGSKPTIADFERTWEMSQSQSGTGGLYWKYNEGSQTEFVEVTEPMESNTFYIMLYNNGRQGINTRLTYYSYA